MDGEDERSALHMIVQGSRLQHLKMLEGEIIQKLLEEKWNRYAKKILLTRFVWAVVHLTLISTAIILRPSGDLMTGIDRISWVRYAAEVSALVSCAARFVLGFYELRTQHGTIIQSFIELPEKCLSLVSVCLLYACVPLRLTGLRASEDIVLAVAVPLSWCYLLLFYRANRNLGPLVVIIGKMCTGDLLRFVIIYCIFIYMFAGAFYYAYLDVSEEESYKNVKSTIVNMFHMTFSKFKTRDLRLSRAPWQVCVVFVVFALVIPVLLLNMLIAKMARTFEKIKDRSWMEWKRQWAMIILNMERTLTHSCLDQYQKAYSTEVLTGRAPPVREVLTHQPQRTSLSWKEQMRATTRRHFGSFRWQRSLREEYLTVESMERASSDVRGVDLAMPEEVEEGEKKQKLCRALLVTKRLPRGQARVRNVCERWREAGHKALRKRDNVK